MKLFGKEFTRYEIENYCGNINQIGGTCRLELKEGATKGTEIINVNTGSGLEFRVVPDRGLDISIASFKGINLTYNSPAGEVNPAYYNYLGSEWQRSFFGGLLTTCGLTYLGHPNMDESKELGLHGRYSNTPAKNIVNSSGWLDDEYVISIKGIVEDSVLFEPKLRLNRTIKAKIGENKIFVEDEIENYGSVVSPLTILYHINMGFPLLSEHTNVFLNAKECISYKDILKNTNAPCANGHIVILPPTNNYQEEAFLYHFQEDKACDNYVVVVNNSLLDGLGLYVKYKNECLPNLTLWKMFDCVDYVLGIEPSNVKCLGRSILRERNELPYIKPGEKIILSFEIGVLDGKIEINEFLKNKEDIN